MLTSLIVDSDNAPVTELVQRFFKERASGSSGPAVTGRSVGQLLQAAKAYAAKRQLVEEEERTKEKARREREASIAREKHLDSLVGRETKLWAKVDNLIATKQPNNYDEAVKILVDLRDLDARGKGGDFRLRIEALRLAQSRKPSLLDRIRKADL